MACEKFVGRPFVKRFALSYRTVVCSVLSVPSVCNVGVLWPNGWMDQGGTWYRGRPRPMRLCVRWGPNSPPKRGTAPSQFSAHVCCGQTAGWMKMQLGTEVDLSPGHIVLDGDPALAKGAQQPPPLFSAHVYCDHGRPSQLLLSSCYSFRDVVSEHRYICRH